MKNWAQSLALGTGLLMLSLFFFTTGTAQAANPDLATPPTITSPIDGESYTVYDGVQVRGTATGNPDRMVVSVYVDQAYQGSAELDCNANHECKWSMNLNDLSEGSHSLTAFSFDYVDGEFSDVSNVLYFEVAYAQPGAPTLLVPNDGDVITDTSSPYIRGIAHRNDHHQVEVFVDGHLAGTAGLACVAGENVCSFAVKVSSPLINGQHAATAYMVDTRNGNRSKISNAVTFTVDKNLVIIPTMVKPYSDSTVTRGQAAATGIYHNGDGIAVYVDNVFYGWAETLEHVSGTGSFGLELKDLSLGTHTVYTRAVSPEGQFSEPSEVRTVHVVAPVVATAPSSDTSSSDDTDSATTDEPSTDDQSNQSEDADSDVDSNQDDTAAGNEDSDKEDDDEEESATGTITFIVVIAVLLAIVIWRWDGISTALKDFFTEEDIDDDNSRPNNGV